VLVRRYTHRFISAKEAQNQTSTFYPPQAKFRDRNLLAFLQILYSVRMFRYLAGARSCPAILDRKSSSPVKTELQKPNSRHPHLSVPSTVAFTATRNRRALLDGISYRHFRGPGAPESRHPHLWKMGVFSWAFYRELLRCKQNFNREGEQTQTSMFLGHSKRKRSVHLT